MVGGVFFTFHRRADIALSTRESVSRQGRKLRVEFADCRGIKVYRQLFNCGTDALDFGSIVQVVFCEYWFGQALDTSMLQRAAEFPGSHLCGKPRISFIAAISEEHCLKNDIWCWVLYELPVDRLSGERSSICTWKLEPGAINADEPLFELS
jgi:hypothetical protein